MRTAEDLLRDYILHVTALEGTDFLSDCMISFSREEADYLYRLAGREMPNWLKDAFGGSEFDEPA